MLLGSMPSAYAQSSKKHGADSAMAARKHILDSTRDARQHALDSAAAARKHFSDSLKTAREHKTDSLTKARKHRTDSLNAIKKYKDSRKYKDSVARARKKQLKKVQDARQARADSIKEVREHRTDSLTAMRKERTDSISTARKIRTDSIATVRKHRTDSLAKVKKYKASKRYSDSVTLVRKIHSDSIKTVQKNFRDSIAAVRKHNLDSVKIARTKKLDSIKIARTKYMDSVKLVRKAKTDSLAKKKADKEKLAKANEKKKMQQMHMKLELKLKQKREAWSNTTMLKKKWGPLRRATQNSFTHYNYYYNARRKMGEAEANMQRIAKDNYDSLIDMFPFDPNRDSSILSADMDSIIRKASVGIQIHDPRIKWGDDMYLLLGQSYYYKGGYENAAVSFRYIISANQKKKNKKGKGSHSYYSRSRTSPSIVDKKKKSKLAFWQHKSVLNDAILWLARTYTTAGQIEDAESILSLLEYDPDLPDNLLGRLAVEKAFAYLKDGNYPEASKQLTIAIQDENLPSWLRMRMAFLNGQLLQMAGNHLAAAENFEKVLTYFPKIEMDFYARKYIAYNKLMIGNNIAEATTPLKRMLKDGKYASQYDQVYYVLGQLEEKNNNHEAAITDFKKSTTTPKASRKQKSLSYAALGDVYYTTSKYTAAKAAYDSASKYATTATKSDKSVASAIKRSAGLKEISGPLAIIEEQDSLLRLAAMSHKEQLSVVRHYLRQLEKRRDDSIFRAQNALTVVPPPDAADKSPGDPVGSWYFSNPTLVSQGSTDFKHKWGSRPLADNWRTSSSASFSSGSSVAGADNSSDDEENAPRTKNGKLAMRDGLPTEDALLSQIPNTPAQKKEAERTEQKAFILLAKAYVHELKDYNQALLTLDTLDSRFPAHTQKEEELYLRYQIALKQGKLDKAQEYATQLVAQFPKSQYASKVQPAKSEARPDNDNTTEVAGYFDETYNLLQKHQYTEARMRAEEGKKKYKHPVYKKRFEIVEAMAHAGSGNYDMADTLLSKFITANPTDSLTGWAKDVKQYVADVRKGGKPSWYQEGYVPHAKKPSEVVAAAEKASAMADPEPEKPKAPEAPAFFTAEPDSPHYVAILLPGLDSRTGKLKQAIKEYNAKKHADAGLDVKIDLYSMTKGAFLISNFTNAEAAKAYLTELQATTILSKYSTGEITPYLISRNNYKKMFADKGDEAYIIFYNAYYNR